MAGYPITLQIHEKPVLIVGGGKIAARKASSLLSAGARVIILSPLLLDSINRLPIQWIAAPYQRKFITEIKPVLVFAATNDTRLNQTIAIDAREYGAWVNVADGAAQSDFHNMAILEKAPFSIGISTNGTSPALLALLKIRLGDALSEGLIILANWLGELRPTARETLDSHEERHRLYQRIIASDVLSLLEAGEQETAYAHFQAIVQEAL